MGEIKERKQLTYVNLRDWRILVTERPAKEICDWLLNNQHIMLEWEMHSRYDVLNAIPVNVDDLESFILTQTKEIQAKLRLKKNRLKTEQGKEMSLSYAQNYVSNLVNKQ